MGFRDVVEGIGTVIGGLITIGVDRFNEHNENVKKLKIKYEKKSVEELKAIVKREFEKGNIFSAEAQAANEILKAKGININNSQTGGQNV